MQERGGGGGNGGGGGEHKGVNVTETLMTVQLKSDLSALSCLKEEKDKSKRRKVAEKLLGNRDPTKCKE